MQQSNNNMKIKFTKDYYTPNNRSELTPMYHFSITKDYYSDDQKEVLQLAIKDLEQKLKELKGIEKHNEEVMQSWDSISK